MDFIYCLMHDKSTMLQTLAQSLSPLIEKSSFWGSQHSRCVSNSLSPEDISRGDLKHCTFQKSFGGSVTKGSALTISESNVFTCAYILQTPIMSLQTADVYADS